jgi:hypothetical protein
MTSKKDPEEVFYCNLEEYINILKWGCQLSDEQIEKILISKGLKK